jgi:hypothetical protein
MLSESESGSRKVFAVGFLALVTLSFLAASGLMAAPGAAPVAQQAPPDRHKALELLDLSPAVFVQNKGQWNSEVRYGFDGKGTRVSFTDAGPVFQTLGPSSEKGRSSSAVFSARFVGARSVTPVGFDASASRTNYYVGSDSAKWRTDVPSYEKIAYRGVYDGVDLYAWGRRSGLKYEFHVAPGASWRQIVVKYDGIEGLSLDEKGALHVATSLGEIVDGAPVVYQKTPSGTRDIAAHFRIVDASSYGFEVTGDVDVSLPLVIDPVIAWGSYFGGSGDEPGGGMMIDASGNILVGGVTFSADFPTTAGAQQTSFAGGVDLVCGKFDSSGTLAWATYIGGNGSDEPRGIAVDSAGYIWSAGKTNSTDFPVTNSSAPAGGIDGWIVRISPGGALSFASYFGGSGDDEAGGMVCTASNSCWVIGTTASTDFPTANAFQNANNGGIESFVIKFASSGARTVSSYLGGSGDDEAQDHGIGVDSTGDLWLAGKTDSTDLPTTGNAFQSTYGGGDQDGFVAEVSPSGSLLLASYVGGGGGDNVEHVEVDSTGNVFFAGWAGSQDFPVTSGQQGMTSQFGSQACIVKISPWQTELWARCFGGDNQPSARDLAVDSHGCLWMVGNISGSSFPSTADAFQHDFGGGSQDCYVAKFSPEGALMFASFIGGSGGEEEASTAIDAFDDLWIGALTDSTDLPATPNAFKQTSSGGIHAFLTKVRKAGTLAWTTYLGGNGTDGGTSLDDQNTTLLPDSDGNAWVAMVTSSTNLQTQAGAFQINAQGGLDLYFAKIDAPGIVQDALPRGMVGTAYSRTLAARAGAAPYTWSLRSGSLPAGLSLVASTGVVSGTPTATGTSSFTIRVTDDQGAWENRPFVVPIAAALVFSTTSLPAGTVGAEYHQGIAVSGGTEPYSGSVQSGNLPAGLSLGSLTGTISGTPSASGTSNFTIRVADDTGATVTKALSIVIHAAPGITTSSLPAGTVGTA